MSASEWGCSSEPGSASEPDVGLGAEAEAVPYFTNEELRNFCENARISSEDMYKLVVNFLVHEGHTAAAGKIVKDTGITPGEKFQQMEDCLSIIKALLFFSIEEAFNFFQAQSPWVFKKYRTLFTNLVKLKSMDMIRVGMESEASQFFLRHMTVIIGYNESLVQQWSEFLRKCKINLDGSIGSAIEQGRLLKMVLDELNPICDLAVMDDIGKMEESLVHSFAKITRRA